MGEHRQQSGPAACAAALYGPDGHVEDLGGLRHGVPLHVDQNQGGPLVGGELGEGDEKLAVEVLALGGCLGGLLRFEKLLQALRVVHGRRLAGGGFPRPVEAGVDSDAVQPCRNGGLAAECVSGAEGGHERVLHGVGGFLAVSQRAQRDGPQAVAVAPYELTEGVGIPRDVTCQEILVVHAAECGVFQR